jgi:O-antigen/teichoic acid export membrane protein
LESARAIARNASWLVLGRAAPALFSFILLVVAARRLGATAYGQFSAAFAFTALLATLTDLGLGYLVTREVARDRSRAGRYLGGMLVILAALFSGTCLVTFLLLPVFGYRSPVREAAWLLTLSWGFTSLTTTFGAIFQAFERMERLAVVWIVRNAAILALGLAALHWRPGVVPLAAAYLAGSLAGAIAARALTDRGLVRIELTIEPAFLKQILVTGVPFGFAVVLQTLYFRVDELMLSVFRAPAELGTYAAAVRLIQGMILVPGVITSAAFPRLARWSHDAPERLVAGYRKLMKLLFLAGLPIAAGGTVLAPEIIRLLYGDAYPGSVTALRILLWALVLLFLTSGVNIVLNALDAVKTTAWVLAACLVVNLVLNFLFIPPWGLDLGYRGACISTLVAEAVNLGLLLASMSRRGVALPWDARWGSGLVAALALAVAALAARGLGPWVAMAAGAAAYVAALFAARAFDASDREIARELRGS